VIEALRKLALEAIAEGFVVGLEGGDGRRDLGDAGLG
jgi:hypothetical protein